MPNQERIVQKVALCWWRRHQHQPQSTQDLSTLTQIESWRYVHCPSIYCMFCPGKIFALCFCSEFDFGYTVSTQELFSGESYQPIVSVESVEGLIFDDGIKPRSDWPRRRARRLSSEPSSPVKTPPVTSPSRKLYNLSLGLDRGTLFLTKTSTEGARKPHPTNL